MAQLHGFKPQILHLDLNPPKILLDKYEHAYLSDFGLSTALQTLDSSHQSFKHPSLHVSALDARSH